MLVRALFLAAVPIAFVVACSSSDDNTSDAGAAQHSTQCSNGTPYAPSFSPPTVPATVTRNASAPTCVAHCGEDGVIIEGSNLFVAPIDALPSGSCQFNGDDCTMTAGNYQVCGSNKVACNLSTFYCTCTNGNWACYTVTQGANSCTTCNPDGGI